MMRRLLPDAGLHLFAVKPAGRCRACRVRRCRIVEGSASARKWRVGIGAAPHHGRMYAPSIRSSLWHMMHQNKTPSTPRCP